MNKEKIGTLSDFPEGRGTKVEVNGIGIAVINVEGELYGISNLCPHKNLPLHPVGQDRIVSKSGEDDIDDDREDRVKLGAINGETPSINCPWHDLEWNLDTGVCEVTKQRIGTFDIEVDADEAVYVTF